MGHASHLGAGLRLALPGTVLDAYRLMDKRCLCTSSSSPALTGNGIKLLILPEREY